MSQPLIVPEKAKLDLAQLDQIKIGVDGQMVVIHTGKSIIKFPWQVGELIAKSIIRQSKRCEVEANKERIASDEAFMLRAGIPIGLTNRIDIKEEAIFQARYDDTLRKQLPGGIKSKEQFGTPTIIKHPPPKKEGKNV